MEQASEFMCIHVIQICQRIHFRCSLRPTIPISRSKDPTTYLQAAAEALDAGNRRKALARSVASTALSSGDSSGKRSHTSVEPTPSTKVTPDGKQLCPAPESLAPRALNFEADEPCEGWFHTILFKATKTTYNSDKHHVVSCSQVEMEIPQNY